MNPPPTPGGRPSWIKTHQGQAVAVAGGLVVLLALKKRASSSGAAGAPASAGTAGSGTVSGAYGYDSSQLDQYNQLAGAISSLNDQVQTLQASSPASAVSTLPPTGHTGISPTSGYTHIASPAAGSTLAASGATIYGEPIAGDFIPVVVAGKWTAAGSAYGKQANNPGLFVKS